jgi:hypothetical protein
MSWSRVACVALATSLFVGLLPPAAAAARPGTANEKKALMTAVGGWLCPKSPRTLRPCPFDAGGPIERGAGYKDVRLHLVSVSQMSGNRGSHPGAAFISFRFREMRFVPDNSFAGGRWTWAYGSSWKIDYRCIEFSVATSGVTDVVRLFDVSDATLPILRLYGNQRGACPVLTTPRKGVRPGWTTASPISTCQFHGRNDWSEDYPASEDYVAFTLRGPGAESMCGALTSVLTKGIYRATFSMSPFPAESGSHMPVLCRFGLTSRQVGDKLGKTLPPADYTLEIRGGDTWRATGDLYSLDFGTGVCQ